MIFDARIRDFGRGPLEEKFFRKEKFRKGNEITIDNLDFLIIIIRSDRVFAVSYRRKEAQIKTTR